MVALISALTLGTNVDRLVKQTGYPNLGVTSAPGTIVR
jgi:hypothetical protein